MARPAASSRSTPRPSIISRPRAATPTRVALVTAYAKAQGLFRTAKSADPVFTETLTLDLGDVVPSMAGPKRPEGRVALPAVAEGFAAAMASEYKKAADASTALSGREPQFRSRPWRRGDRGDHLLHQHLQSERADRRRPAGAQRRRQGPDGKALGQDLAGAGQPGGRGISCQFRPADSISTRSASTWSASAAPPASAIRARCRRRFRSRSTTTASSPPPCCRVTATSKAASARTCRPTTWPRRRWWWPMRWRER